MPLINRSLLAAALLAATAIPMLAQPETSRGPAGKNLPLPPFHFGLFDFADVNRGGVFLMDDAGTPRFTYGHAHEDAGTQYNPTQVAGYAASLYRRASLAETDRARDVALAMLVTQADWLVQNLDIRSAPEARGGKFGVWIFHFSNTAFGATGPWVSGMTQGLGLVALSQAHAVTGDRKYLDAALLAVGAFQVPMAKGGVRTEIAEGGAFYEEVASPEARSTRILNGFIFGLAGLEYFHGYNGDPLARKMFDDGLVALRSRVHSYDVGWQTYYDAERRLAQFGYNSVHAEQMMYLYSVTGDPFFQALGERYELYSRDPEVEVTSDKSVAGHEASALSRWDRQSKRYFESGPLPVTLTVRLTGCMAVYGTWIQGHQKEDTLPEEMDVLVTADGVNWTRPELDEKMTGYSHLDYDEKTMVVVFRKPVLARALRYVIKRSRAADEIVKIDRLRVMAGPTAPVMPTIASSGIRAEEAVACVCELPPQYSVKADEGEWQLLGLTPLSDVEFRGGRTVDVLFYWRHKPTGASRLEVQKTRNLVVNPDLAMGLSGPGHPVGFFPLAPSLPAGRVITTSVRIGARYTRALFVTTTADHPEVFIDALPTPTQGSTTTKYLVAVETPGRPGQWVSYRRPAGSEQRLPTVKSANESWQWHAAILERPANEQGFVRLGLQSSEPAESWFTNQMVLALQVPTAATSTCTKPFEGTAQ